MKSNLQSVLSVQLILEIVTQEYTVARSSSSPLLGCHIISAKYRSNKKNYVGFIKTHNGSEAFAVAEACHWLPFLGGKNNLWEYFMFQDLSLFGSNMFSPIFLLFPNSHGQKARDRGEKWEMEVEERWGSKIKASRWD